MYQFIESVLRLASTLSSGEGTEKKILYVLVSSYEMIAIKPVIA